MIGRSLSAKLLLLTILFVLVAEVLIFAPSIGRFRMVFIEEKMSQAYLAALAVRAAPGNMITSELESELLERVDAHQIVVEGTADVPATLMKRISPLVDTSYNMDDATMIGLILEAFAVLSRADNRIIEVTGRPPDLEEGTMRVVFDEGPLRDEMIDYSLRILALSIAISVIAASLIFVAITGLLVRPIKRITNSMVEFRKQPESDDATIPLSGRLDEIGVAEGELLRMQETVRTALKQKTRLAMLGTAVAKINHDLRNLLSTGSILTERLADSEDETVRKIAPKLVASLDRAVVLCQETLNYTSEGGLPVRRVQFDLFELIAEASEDPISGNSDTRFWQNTIEPGFTVSADREQLFRAMINLARNAFEAGADTVSFRAARESAPAGSSFPERVRITVSDNGPGLPPRARENLFVPFAGSARRGGTGLGLTIVQEILRSHGGDIQLIASDAGGTSFALLLPIPAAARDARLKAPPKPEMVGENVT